jgi:hypothetical protein
MMAAAWPRARPEEERLLWIDPVREAWSDARVGDLPALVRSACTSSR